MNIEELATHLSEYGSTMTTSQFRQVLTDTFAAGERKGRIAGLRAVADVCNLSRADTLDIYQWADRLEREAKEVK